MSWYDILQRLAASAAASDGGGYAAQQAAQQLPQTMIPAGGPPQRPDSGLYGSTQVPLPPQRPQGITPLAAGPQYGNPGVTMPSGLPYEPDQSSIPQTQGLQARQVPLPPQRPTALAMGAGGMPDISGRPSLPAAGAQAVSAQAPRNVPMPPPRPADLSAPSAQPVQAQAPQGQGQMHPAGQVYQGADGGWYRDVPGKVQLSPVHGLAALLGAQPSLQASTSSGPTAFLDQLFGFRTDPTSGQ
uniref:hypothetical protein n=1 Tax=Methylobacterium sp. B34 TaxID=95563 RepID=UPI0005B2CED5|nr:hypothetical protein [Methylobacterium sp. B34]